MNDSASPNMNEATPIVTIRFAKDIKIPANIAWHKAIDGKLKNLEIPRLKKWLFGLLIGLPGLLHPSLSLLSGAIT